MGGLIILASIIVPVILFGDLRNIYVQLMLFITIWLGTVGFIDDYIKVFRKNKEGLRGTFKIIAQIIAGLVVGLTLHFNDDIVAREKVLNSEGTAVTRIMEGSDQQEPSITYVTRDVKSTRVNVPFFKNNEFDYAMLIGFLGEKARDWAWIVVILAVILIITFISNGANLTDGLDGLAAGTSAIIGLTLGILAYVSGNVIFSDYLNIMYLPNTGELVVFILRLHRCPGGIFMVQFLPGAGFYGRHGKPGHRGNHCRVCHPYPQGTVNPYSLRYFCGGEPVGSYPGGPFQIYKAPFR